MGRHNLGEHSGPRPEGLAAQNSPRRRPRLPEVEEIHERGRNLEAGDVRGSASARDSRRASPFFSGAKV